LRIAAARASVSARRGQDVVRGGFGVLQGEVEAVARERGEGDAVGAGFGAGTEDVQAAAQRVGDADRVVVGVDQRALVAVDGP
jgi:hypothetical protein